VSENKNLPLALKRIDEELGSSTVPAYEHAVDTAPHLEGMAIILKGTSNGSTFQASPEGLAGSYINLQAKEQVYKNLIHSGVAKIRMAEYSRFYRQRGITPSVKELVTSTFLHEMGHADDFHRYISDAQGDVSAAFDLSRSVRASQIATLPFKTATSNAVLAWENNTEGYRDRLQAAGYTDEMWESAVFDNIRAYSELPCEKVADHFALGVLATMYGSEK
jgi:aryl carrier-like protein